MKNNVKLLKEQYRAKFLAGVITENEYKESLCEEIIEEGGIAYTLLEVAQKVVHYLMEALNDPSNQGLSPFFKKLGMSRGEMFSMMADAGIIGGALYALIKGLSQEMRDKLADKVKKLFAAEETPFPAEPTEPLKNTFKDPNRI
jgi:hypothetical protein